jgi:DNA excision repair protein ERCC-4
MDGLSMAKQSEKPLEVPFTVLIDQREKAPYFFHGLRAGSSRSYRPLVVNYKLAHLKTGDYSISGLENLICIERKSLADLYSTLGSNRDRFEAEHERMTEFSFAAVVVEASIGTVLKSPPKESRLLPKSVYGTYIAWSMRYGVPWIFAEDRRLAEKTTFKLLEKFFEEHSRKEVKNHGNIGCNTDPVFNSAAVEFVQH